MTQGLCQEDELFFTRPNIRRYPLFDEKKIHVTQNNSHSEEWENVIVHISQGKKQLKRELVLSQSHRERQ